MKTKILVGLLISASAFAALNVSYLYKITGVVDAGDGWVGLTTLSGTAVFVRCSKRQFDDVTHDKIASFKSVEACEEFVATLRSKASPMNPIVIERDDNYGVNILL